MTHPTLRIALVEGENYTPLYETLHQFSEETGYTVEAVTRLPLPELIDHLAASVGEYDLVSAHSQYTAGLAAGLMPLDELLPAETLAEYDPQFVALCGWEGRVYQLPRSVEARLLYYRSDIFENRQEQGWFREASGGRELRVPQTWEDLAVVAQYFTRDARMHGFGFPGRESGLLATFAEMLATMGGTCFDADGRPRFFSRAGEWSLTLLRDLYTRWQAVPPEATECGYEEMSELFRMGKCAMALDFPGGARLLRDPTFSAVASWHSVALYPAGPDGRRAVWTGCPTFAIPAASRQQEAAVRLLLFLAGRESQFSEAKYGAFPAHLEAREDARTFHRVGTLGNLRLTLLEQTLRLAALSAPPVRQFRQMETALWPLLREAVVGELGVTEALHSGRLAVEALLSSES